MWLCVLNSTLPGVYVIVAAEILHAFGRGHYEAIFGLYYSHYLLLMAVNLILKVRSEFHKMLLICLLSGLKNWL